MQTKTNLSHDAKGYEWVKLSELRLYDEVITDGSFTCLDTDAVPGAVHMVHVDKLGFYILCREGKHYLSGQVEDGEHCIGIYKVLP